MTIIAFAKTGTAAAKIIGALAGAGIPVFAIFTESGPTGQTGNKTSLNSRLAAILHRGPRTIWSRIVDHGQEIEYRLIRVAGLPVPRSIPSWIAYREQYTVDFYKRFSQNIVLVDSFNGTATFDALTQIKPDIVVLAGVTRIIRQHIIKLPRLGILNAHPGILPKYRGVDPIPYALLAGYPLGVTVHFIDEGVDSGPVLAQGPLVIRRDDTMERLWSRSEDVAAELMTRVVKQLIIGTADPKPQDESRAVVHHKISTADNKRAHKILRQLQRKAN